MNDKRDVENHHLIAGALCLDYANTLYGHTELVHEYLFDYRDLVLWSRRVETLTPQKAEKLLLIWEQAPAESDAVFRQAIHLRETIFHVFASLAQGVSPDEDELSKLHQSWLENQSHLKLVHADSGYSLEWEVGETLDVILWPITRSAIELLTTDELKQVKQCGRCDWLFVDRSRNHKRRWCSMSACGNRVKMSRRYEREKQSQ